MKTDTSANLNTHLAGEVATIALCIKAVRTDAQVFGFTSHDVDIPNISGIPGGSTTYESDSVLIGRTELETSSNMNVDDMEFSGVTSDSITEADLRNGVWANCEFYLFIVNYKSTADGPVKMARGKLGNVTLGANTFQAEMRRMLQNYSRTILRLYTTECDATFCGARCGLDETDYRWRVRVDAATDNQVFTVEEYIETVNASFTLTNPGFELGDVSGWTLETTATFAASATAPRTGTYCGRITGVSGDHVYIRQRIDLVAAGIPTSVIDAGDCDITVGWWATNESTTSWVEAGIRYLDTSLIELSENYGTQSQPPNSPTYGEYSFEETAPATARHADVMFHGRLPSASLSKCKFDDATASFSYVDYASATPDVVVGLDTDNYFVWGWVEWLTGNNTGAKMEIIAHTGSTKEITLFLPMQYAIAAEDEFYLYRGCKKTLAQCRDDYDNVDNHRGFPYLPLKDVLEYPDAQA